MTFLTGYNGIINVTISNNKFSFAKSITVKDGLIQFWTPEVAFETESLNYEINRFIIQEDHFTETDYQFTIKPNFSTLGPIIEISRQKTKTII